MGTKDLPASFSVLENIAKDFKQLYFVYNPGKNQFTYLNPAFSQIWEVNTDDVLQNPALLINYIHPEDKEFVLDQYFKLKQNEQAKILDFRIITPSEQTKWLTVSVGIYAETTTGEDYIGGFATEVTNSTEYLNTTLNFSAKKNATLEVLSHDLATPFANIQGMVELLEYQLQEGNTEVSQMLEFIKQDAIRGSNLIQDFVGNEFLESSQVVLIKKRLDIKGKIQLIMEDYKNGQSLMGKEIRFNAPDHPVYVEVDDLKFMQVLNNLISNAIKFTPDNGIITLSVKDKPESTLFSVRDNGIGIPDRLQPFVFEKFSKARRDGVRGEKANGLGLNIIKNIVGLHQGKVWFESREGAGSTFYIEIPKLNHA